MMQVRKLEDIDFKGKKVFLRLDLNVPIKKGKISDDTRIRAALPTIRHILQSTNKIVMASHLGRPDGEIDMEYSLAPVGERLAELLGEGREVLLVSDYVQEPVDRVIRQLGPKQIILLENLRFHAGETKNDAAYAKTLMNGMDIYVDDAFGAVHRAHASITGAAECVAPEHRAAGLLLQKEIEVLDGLQRHPESPFTVIIGGAKVADKIGVMLNLINQCNTILVGGAMAYTFLKFHGIDVGSSRVEADKMDLVQSIYRNAENRRVRIELPIDHVCARSFSETETPLVVETPDIPEGLMGLDIGPATIKKYASIIEDSKTILWNGPMGVFEWPAFAKGSMAIAEAVARSHGKTVVGGGDSVSLANKAGIADKLFHVSTGGGASLEFLEGKMLPGVRVLLKN